MRILSVGIVRTSEDSCNNATHYCRKLEPEATPDPDNLRNRYMTYLKEVEDNIQKVIMSL